VWDLSRTNGEKSGKMSLEMVNNGRRWRWWRFSKWEAKVEPGGKNGIKLEEMAIGGGGGGGNTSG